jgi:biopolymer transport protein TolQ
MDTVAESSKIDWFSIILNGGPVGLAIMILLAIMSVWAWVVIIGKLRSLSNLHNLSERFLSNFWEAKSLSELNLRVKDMDYSPAREVFRSGFNEMIRVLQTREKRGATGNIKVKKGQGEPLRTGQSITTQKVIDHGCSL